MNDKNEQPSSVNESGPSPDRLQMPESVSTDPAVAFQLELGLTQYPGAFAAYLQLSDVDVTHEDIISRFQSDFVARYSTRRECCTEQLEMLGWAEKLTALKHSEGIADDLLVWNYSQLWSQVIDVWDVVETDEGIYLFAK